MLQSGKIIVPRQGPEKSQILLLKRTIRLANCAIQLQHSPSPTLPRRIGPTPLPTQPHPHITQPPYSPVILKAINPGGETVSAREMTRRNNRSLEPHLPPARPSIRHWGDPRKRSWESGPANPSRLNVQRLLVGAVHLPTITRPGLPASTFLNLVNRRFKTGLRNSHCPSWSCGSWPCLGPYSPAEALSDTAAQRDSPQPAMG